MGHRDAKTKLTQTRDKIKDTKKRIRVFVEADEDQLIREALDGQCISKQLAEYKYEICFFKDAKQNSVSIGKWKKWENAFTGIFDDGAMCPGGIARSLRVNIRCGTSEIIEDLTEPGRCAYEAT